MRISDGSSDGCSSDRITDIMNRVRQPFNVNSIAQAAAVASLQDDEFVARSYALNQAGMKQITLGFERLGLDYITSFGNFVSFRVSNAAHVFQQLLRNGVILRPVANYEMPEYLRVSIGLFAENARFLEVLRSEEHTSGTPVTNAHLVCRLLLEK